MKITVEQFGLKSSIEYHDDELSVKQLGALLYGACLGVGWSEDTLAKILNQDNIDYNFKKQEQ
jgi:hypothetical protein